MASQHESLRTVCTARSGVAALRTDGHDDQKDEREQTTHAEASDLAVALAPSAGEKRGRDGEVGGVDGQLAKGPASRTCKEDETEGWARS